MVPPWDSMQQTCVCVPLRHDASSFPRMQQDCNQFCSNCFPFHKSVRLRFPDQVPVNLMQALFIGLILLFPRIYGIYYTLGNI